jgi:hypothetical protein
MMLNLAGQQPSIALAEMQPAGQHQYQFNIELPSLPPLVQLQSAYAEVTVNSAQSNTCQESGPGGPSAHNCPNIILPAIDLGTPDPPGASNLYDVTINRSNK